MKSNALRDVVIFVAVMVATGWAGVLLNVLMQPADPMEGLGSLTFLLGPPIAGVVLAFMAGNGFRRLGLGLGEAGSGKWYALAAVVTPVAVAIVLPVGLLVGAIKFLGVPTTGLMALAVTYFVSSAIKNIFEELSWRGFLTPRLEETRFAGLPNHLITGVIWAIWHVPYWLFFISAADIAAHTGLTLAPFIAIAFLIMPLQAIFYGELRLVTGSMWPSFVLHTVSNTVTMVLLSGALVTLEGPLGVVLSPGTSGILYSVLLAAIGLGLYRRRTGGGSERPTRGVA